MAREMDVHSGAGRGRRPPGVVLVAVIAAAGWQGIATARADAADAFAEVPAASIATALGDGGARNMVLPITEGDGIDILLVGSSQCPQCRRFVAQDFGGLADFARREGLGLSYASTAMSPAGLIVGAAQHCAGDTDAASAAPSEAAETLIRRIYAATPRLAARVRAMYGRVGYDAASAIVSRRLAPIVRDFHADIGGQGRADPACYIDRGTRTAREMRALKIRLKVTATPTFLFDAGDGQGIKRFLGRGGLDAMRRLFVRAPK